jgi:hypothetical protein
MGLCVGLESEAHPVVVAGRGARGEGWITSPFCGFVWRLGDLVAGSSRRAVCGSRWGPSRRLVSTPAARAALRLDRALAGGEEGLTAGGMTLPMSTDPLGRGRALLRLYRTIVTREGNVDLRW